MKNRLKKQIIIRYVSLFTFIAVGLILLGFVKAPKAYSAQKTIPGYWQMLNNPDVQRGDLSCEWQQTDHIMCYGTAGGLDKVDYFFDVKKSVEAEYLVFTARGGNPNEYGYLTLSRGSANDAYISTDYKNPKEGVDIVDLTRDAVFKERNDDSKDNTNPRYCGVAERQLKVGCLNGWDESASGTTNQDISKIENMIGALSTGTFGSCDNAPGLVIQYVVCPILRLMQDGLASLIGGTGISGGGERKGLLITFLQIKPVNLSDTNSSFYRLLQGMINVANALYIVIFLIIIFSSSLPYGLDNYSIKKMLPKFILAVILTQFSPLICGLIIDFFNILGQVVPNIIFALAEPAGGLDLSKTGDLVTSSISNLLGIAALPFLIVLLLIMLLLACIGAFIGFIYMIIRLLLIYTMIVLSPIAFLCMVLPGTKKFFDTWWSGFIRLNAMFVTITGMIALAIVLSNALKSSAPTIDGNTEPDGTGVILYLASALIPVAAFMLIPKTLKWTTQAMNGLAGAVMNGAMNKGSAVGKKAFDKSKGKASEISQEQRNKMAVKQFGKGNFRRGAMIQGKLPTKKNIAPAAEKTKKYLDEKAQREQSSYKLLSSLQGMEFGEANDELEKIAKGKGSTRLGVNAGKDRNAQSAAIRELAARGEIEKLRGIKTGLSDPQDIAMFSEAIEPSLGDISAKAPDIVKPIDKAYADITAAKLPSLDKTSWDVMFDYAERTGDVASIKSALSTAHGSKNITDQLSGAQKLKINDFIAKQEATSGARWERQVYDDKGQAVLDSGGNPVMQQVRF